MSRKRHVIITDVFLKFLEDDMGGIRDGVRIHRCHIGEGDCTPTFESEEFVVLDNLKNGHSIVCQVLGHSNSYDQSHRKIHKRGFTRNTVVMSYRLMRRLGIRDTREKTEVLIRKMNAKDKFIYFLRAENPKERWTNWLALAAVFFALMVEVRHLPPGFFRSVFEFLRNLF